MTKVAKKTQTDFTRGGKAISDTAIPYYQNTLGTLNDYIQNPYGTVDTIMNKYYNNNAMQNDFLRNYNRAMANTSAGNYSATGGGYSSAGQRAYNDQQRYQNDLASRLQQYGVGQAFAGQNQLFGQALAGTEAFNNAYGLGQPYSDVEQWNYQADQVNNPWTQIGQIGGTLMQGVGGALSLVPGVGTAVGAGLMAGGKALSGMSDVQMDALTGNQNVTSGVNNSGWVQSFGKNIDNSILTNKEAGYDWRGRPIKGGE